MLAVVLALGSSACYGLSNFIGPQLARTHALVSVLVVSQLAALAACLVYVLGDGGPALPASATLLALLAGAGNAGGLIFFYKAAELGPLSVAAPIGATGAVLPVAWGLASGDALRWTQALGLVLALGGAALAARRTAAGDAVEPAPAPPLADASRTSEAAAAAVPRAALAQTAPGGYVDPRASAAFAVLSAIAFGVFLTALPAASDDGHAWALLDARLMLIALVALWAGRRLAAIRVERSWPLLTVPGLLLVAGTLLYVTAADHGQLSLVSVLGSLFPLVTVGLAAIVLGERLSPLQATGITAALAGIVLIAA